MIRTLSSALLFGVAGALATAAPAAADEAGYLELREKYVYFSEDQLLSAGYQVCQATRSGMVSPDIVNMVKHNFDAGTAPATDIVAGAIVELC
ncbi:DUF732 domain-containing protein [Mycobacterium sp. WMMD1722]|uniref:DUF732 domain-containing protein n=1 Tax=Mycobacterium sp. WMMD1722 TaxID=3404117 RepID=UPI003BF4AE15